MSPLLSKKSFESSKCTSLLELILERIKILRSKRSIIAKQSRDDVAKLLQKGQDANAAARAEHAFREENIVGAYDLLEMYCRLIIKRINAIKSQTECPSDLKEAIASLVYAAPRCGDLQELQKIRDIFSSKYGVEHFVAESDVNEQIIQKLSSRPPNSDTRLNLLKQIAIEYRIDWNYQKAVAASFKNGETSDKPKVSTSANQVSKGGIPTVVDNERPLTPVSILHQEQASSAAQKSIPSTPHNISPGPREFVGASKISNVGSPTRVDNHNHVPLHHNRVKESKISIVGSSTIADKPKPIPGFTHRDELKGQPRSAATSANSSPTSSTLYKEKGFASPMQVSDGSKSASVDKLKPTSVFLHQDELAEKASSASHNVIPSTAQNGSKAFANPIEVSNLSITKSPEKRKPELDGLKGQTTSTPAFYQAKVFSPKATPRPITTDASAESLVAKQYMLAHKSYVKADTAGGEEDHRSKDNLRVHLKPKPGAHSSNVDPYLLPRQEGKINYRNVSHSYEQAQETKRTPQTMDEEEDTSAYEYYARGQTKGAQYRRVSNAPSHEGASLSQMSKERGGDKNAFNSQARHQPEESSLNYEKNPLTLPELSKGLATRPTRPAISLAHPELKPAKMKAESELSGLETATESAFVSAAHAANAAKAAIDMVRTNSRRSRADRNIVDAKGFQREDNQKTSFISSRRDGRTITKDLPGMMDEHSSEQDSYKGKLGKVENSVKHGFGRADAVYPMVHRQMAGHSSGLNSDSTEDEPERMRYRNLLSRDDEMLNRKAEIQVAPHVQKRTVLVGTQELELESEVGDCELESRKTCYNTSTRKHQEPFKDNANVGIRRKHETNFNHTPPHQQQEPLFYNSEKPQFDDYSSGDESSVEELPFYSKGRPAATRKDDAQVNKREAPNKPKQSVSPIVEQGLNNFANESLHLSVKRNLQQDFSESLHNDDDSAESVDFWSPKSSCSSYQHSNSEIFSGQNDVQHSRNPQFDEYEESDNVPPVRSHVSSVTTTRIANGGTVGNTKHDDMRMYHREQQWRLPTSSEHVDNGMLRWRASVPEELPKPTHDARKERWPLRASEEVDEQPPLQVPLRASQHGHDPAITAQATQAGTGKFYGQSRRSVRSSRPT